MTDGRDERCIFCAIAAGNAEASVIYADDVAVAFMDLNPATSGHLLVAPRRHVVGLEDADDDTSGHVWSLAHRLSRALRRSGLRCDGINILVADGKAAFQEVLHLHLHVVPRFAGDGFRIDADWQQRPRAVLDADAQLLRNALTDVMRLS